MKTIPIRLRLTFWYCMVFGALLIVIVSAIYVSHRTAHYQEIDLHLTSVALHVRDELEGEIRDGATLSSIRYDFGNFAVYGVYMVIKNAEGVIMKKGENPLNAPDVPLPQRSEKKDILQTIQEPLYGRFRILMLPIEDNNDRIVGYIQAEISLNSLDIVMERFFWVIAAFTGAGLLAAAWGGWLLAKKALRRVELIGQTAKAIAASQGFDQRVLYTGPKDELGQLADTFNEMLESLDKAFSSHRRFVADASHELRAPLTTIRGNLDILQRISGIPDEERQEILQDMSKEAIRMSKMIGDLLSLARADTGQDIQMEKVDLSLLTDEVVVEVRHWQVPVSINHATEPALYTWGNSDLLKQLLLILVDNAVRYSPAGGEVRLSACHEGKMCILRIKDTGIGIHTKDLPYIFERFYRSEAARSFCPEGTGLGLSIAKWIVEQHNGTIIVTSEPGQGSEFQVRLPSIIAAPCRI